MRRGKPTDCSGRKGKEVSFKDARHRSTTNGAVAAGSAARSGQLEQSVYCPRLVDVVVMLLLLLAFERGGRDCV